MDFKFLHQVGEGTFWLDHRLVPEVRGMLAAMSSRAPLGGVRARYGQIVEALAESLWEQVRADAEAGDGYENKRHVPSWTKANEEAHRWSVASTRSAAEDRLCEYPLHPKVQKFFDDFVGKYGHSSILELVGGQAVFSEGISWFTAWLTFDSPLCAGQEFSTRAVQHKDWPMARECLIWDQTPEEEVEANRVSRDPTSPLQERREAQYHPGWHMHPGLRDLHEKWFEVFLAEVAWWKAEFTSACQVCAGSGEVEAEPYMLSNPPLPRVQCAPCKGTGKKHPSADKEPFRPALDRARWALPGTISTGCAHTTSIRERSRVIRDGSLLAQAGGSKGAAKDVWEDIRKAYVAAFPGLSGMGLREAVYGTDSKIPGHLASVFSDAPDGPDVEIDSAYTSGLYDVKPFKRDHDKAYLDPLANTLFRVNLAIRCSLAVARDWHRHRTFYPWHLQVVREALSPRQVYIEATNRSEPLPYTLGPITIDHHYGPCSDLAKEKVPELLLLSTRVFDAFMAKGDVNRAALALPLGTRVRIRGQGGLRDGVYVQELRQFAHGANFEYKDQAEQAGLLLQAQMHESYALQDLTVADLLGITHQE